MISKFSKLKKGNKFYDINDGSCSTFLGKLKSNYYFKKGEDSYSTSSNKEIIKEEQILQLILNWYTNDMCPDIFQNEDGLDLEEWIELRLKLI